MGYWEARAIQDALEGNWDDAIEDQINASFRASLADLFWTSAKRDPFATENVMFSSYDHGDLHHAGVWSKLVAPSYLPTAGPQAN